MSSLDSLPGDQRAVLSLVLSRGRSYEQIAQALKMDRSAVRERAQGALRALGPQTALASEHQHQVADYLLGQLSDPDAQQVRELLARSPADRAWARVVSSELAPLAQGSPMPEIPVEGDEARQPAEPVPDANAERSPAASEPVSGPAAAPALSGLGPAQPDAEPTGRRRGRRRREKPGDPSGDGPRSSRLGGAIVIAASVAAVAAVLYFVVLKPKSHNSSPSAAAGATTPASSTSAPPSSTSSTTSATSSGSTSARVLAQINLKPPTGAGKGKPAGIAEVLNEGSTDGVAIVAQNVAPNSTKPPNAYAVWLYNSHGDAKLLGFVNPGVGKTGRLSTAGGLPGNASHYKNLIVTVETTARPKAPGTIILQGPLSGL